MIRGGVLVVRLLFATFVVAISIELLAEVRITLENRGTTICPYVSTVLVLVGLLVLCGGVGSLVRLLLFGRLLILSRLCFLSVLNCGSRGVGGCRLGCLSAGLGGRLSSGSRGRVLGRSRGGLFARCGSGLLCDLNGHGSCLTAAGNVAVLQGAGQQVNVDRNATVQLCLPGDGNGEVTVAISVDFQVVLAVNLNSALV